MFTDKEAAWQKFSKTGSVADYLEFKNCTGSGSAEAKSNENEYRRSGSQSGRHGRK